MNKKIILSIFLILALVLGLILFKNSQVKDSNTDNPQNNTENNVNDSPRIVSTKPDPLDQAIVSATEVIEISFNQPLQNAPEFKTRIDPEVEYKIELSQDRKVAKIIFQKPLELGTAYTLFISPESKFDGGGKLDGEKTYHFKTITYRGV